MITGNFTAVIAYGVPFNYKKINNYATRTNSAKAREVINRFLITSDYALGVGQDILGLIIKSVKANKIEDIGSLSDITATSNKDYEEFYQTMEEFGESSNLTYFLICREVI